MIKQKLVRERGSSYNVWSVPGRRPHRRWYDDDQRRQSQPPGPSGAQCAEEEPSMSADRGMTGRSCAKSNAWWRRNSRWKKRSTKRCAKLASHTRSRLSRAVPEWDVMYRKPRRRTEKTGEALTRRWIRQSISPSCVSRGERSGMSEYRRFRVAEPKGSGPYFEGSVMRVSFWMPHLHSHVDGSLYPFQAETAGSVGVGLWGQTDTIALNGQGNPGVSGWSNGGSQGPSSLRWW